MTIPLMTARACPPRSAEQKNVGSLLHPCTGDPCSSLQHQRNHTNTSAIILPIARDAQREPPDPRRSNSGNEVRWQDDSSLNHPHVLGAGSFRSLSDVVRDPLSLPQFFIGHTIQGRAVKEHVCAGSIFNKSESFRSESFDRAFFCHRCCPILSKTCVRPFVRETLTRSWPQVCVL